MKLHALSFDKSVFSSVGYYQRNPPTGAHCCLNFTLKGKRGEVFFVGNGGAFLGCDHCGGDAVLFYDARRSVVASEYRYCPGCFFSLFEEEALRIYQWLMSENSDDWRFPPGGHKVEERTVQLFMVFVHEEYPVLFDLFYDLSREDAEDVSLEEMREALHSKNQGDDGDSLDELEESEDLPEEPVKAKDGIGRDLLMYRPALSISDYSGDGQQRSFDEALERILRRGPR